MRCFVCLIALPLLLSLNAGCACSGCERGEATGAPETASFQPDATVARARPLAIVPADGSPPLVARGYEHLAGASNSRIVRSDLAQAFASREWQPGDRVAFAGTCTGSVPSCGSSCVKIGNDYRTLTQTKFYTCQDSGNPSDICWTSFRVYCKERWYRDSACTDEIEDYAVDHFDHVCD